MANKTNNNKGRGHREDENNRMTRSLQEPEWLTAHKIDLDNKVRDLIKHDFPTLITELSLLLSSKVFVDLGAGFVADKQQQDLEQASTDKTKNVPVTPVAQTKRLATLPVRGGKRCHTDDDVESTELVSADKWAMSPAMIKIIEDFTAILIKLEKDSKTIRMWITLLVPKIEDGNNFGVSVQQFSIFTSAMMELEARKMFNDLLDYFSDRADIIVDQQQYNSVEDFAVAIREHDKHEADAIYRMVRNVRNNCAISLDHLLKNTEKILKPKSDNFSSMF